MSISMSRLMTLTTAAALSAVLLTGRQIENAILTRARELYISTVDSQ